MSWHPKSQVEPVLWLSELAKLEVGEPIRGGVPICWPWFGPHPHNPRFPGHGYARISPWSLSSVDVNSAGEVEVKLNLLHTEKSASLELAGWQSLINLSVLITIGSNLRIDITTENQSNAEIVLTEGLHTYFKVGDIKKISIKGLDGVEYIDLIDGGNRKIQVGPITFVNELGRIFLNTEATCVIEDPLLGRKIVVEKVGSLSTAIWNPWEKTSKTMSDLGATGWRGMVCVEGANALENTISIKPKKDHKLTTTYFVESLNNNF